MGYTTTFKGRIEVTPSMPTSLVDEIKQFSEQRHGGNMTPHPGFPGFWCDIESTPDGTALVWNGNEKSYYMTEWMQYVIDHFLKPNFIANGVLEAYGEEPGDVWGLRVVDNVATHATANIKFTYE